MVNIMKNTVVRRIRIAKKMTEAINSLGGMILTLQGNGDYEGTAKLIEKMSVVDPTLAGDLKRVNEANIPTDIRFKQGKSVLGLQ